MLNSVIIHGRLTKDIELKQTNNGAAVITFSVANDRFVNGEKKTDFFDLIAWNQNAKFINQHFKKGDGIIVVGRLQNREYVDSNGNNRRIIEIVVDRVEFAGGNKEKTANAESADEIPNFEP